MKKKIDLDETQDPGTIDFKLSWILLRRNFKPFLGMAVFTFFISTFVNIFLFIFYISVRSAQGGFNDGGSLVPIPVIISIIVIQMFFTLAFGNCVYGFAYDIISSGDMFAEFRGAFSYFRQYWWQYILLSFISGLFQFVLLFIDQFTLNSILPIYRFFIYFGISLVNLIYSTFFLFTFPSITANTPLKQSFKENLKVFSHFKQRIVKAIIPYYVLVNIPILILISCLLVFVENIKSGYIWIVELIFFVILIFLTTISSGMRALISTRIYNSYKDLIQNSARIENKEFKKSDDIQVDSIYRAKKKKK